MKQSGPREGHMHWSCELLSCLPVLGHEGQEADCGLGSRTFLILLLFSSSFPAWETKYFWGKADGRMEGCGGLGFSSDVPEVEPRLGGCGLALWSWHFLPREGLFGLEPVFTLPQK